MKDFFISYNSADRSWAEWIAWTLEEGGYSVLIQAWDFRPGGNFIYKMHKAIQETKKTIIVLSESYLKADYTQPEWTGVFITDPLSEKHQILPIMVERCHPNGFLKSIIFADLVGLDAAKATEALLQAPISTRVKPTQAPLFPSSNMQIKQIKDTNSDTQQLINTTINFYRYHPTINHRFRVSDGDIIYSGDSIRVEFKTSYDGFLTVILCDSQLSTYRLELFNRKGEKQNPLSVKAQRVYLLPSKIHGWTMDENEGEELFFVILTSETISNELFSKMLMQMNEENNRGVCGIQKQPMTADEHAQFLEDTITEFLANQTKIQLAKIRLLHHS